MAKVFFNYADRRPSFKEKARIRDFIPLIFREENKELEELNYVFCSDEYLLKINKQFLNHDTYTDIITFDLSESETAIKGEIFISSDRVKENALRYQASLHDEFLRVMFHGVLHLCGYKDKKTPEKKIMREKEDYYMQLFHVKHP